MKTGPWITLICFGASLIFALDTFLIAYLGRTQARFSGSWVTAQEDPVYFYFSLGVRAVFPLFLIWAGFYSFLKTRQDAASSGKSSVQ